MVRLAMVTPAGLLLTLLLFYALAIASGIGARVDSVTDLAPDLNFLMVRQDSDLELRKRELPPEPEEIVAQQQPQLPKLQQPVSAEVNASLPTIHVPNIDVGIQVTLSPSINNLTVPVPELAFDANPTALTQVPPSYPQRALRRKIEGSVVVEFLVTETGTVKPGSIKVVKATPKGIFDKSVIRAIQRWRFKTKIADGKAIPFKARQELQFKLES